MRNIGANVLGIFDLFMATGAIWLGVSMITSSSVATFAEPYPRTWEANFPIDNWTTLGVVGIVIFGLGNIVAAILSFKKKHNSSWYASAIIAAVFLFGFTYHYLVVGETYLLVSGPFLIFGTVQLCLSGLVFWLKSTRSE